MIDKIEFKDSLEKELNARYRYNLMDDSVIILDEETIEAEEYIVFFYNSKKFVETENYSFHLLGNAPIIVRKSDGVKFTTGTAHPTEYYIELYQQGLLTTIW